MKNVNEGGSETAKEEHFLGILIYSEMKEKLKQSLRMWKLNICSTTVNFKIDAGAEVKVITTETFKGLSEKETSLKAAKWIFRSPWGTLTCKRKFTAST